MLGTYLSEDAVEELNIFIEAVTKSTKGGASTTDSTLKLMKYTTDSVDTMDSIRMMNSMNKHDSTTDSTNSSLELQSIGTTECTRKMRSTTDSASTTDSTESLRSKKARIYRGSSETTVEDTHNHIDKPQAFISRSCKDACNEGKGKVNSSLPINSDIVEDHITLFFESIRS
jgi:hypothetical protein